MSNFTKAILGATANDRIQKGETLTVTLTYDEPITGATIVIKESHPASLKDDAAITITDGPGGEVQIVWSRADTEKLNDGLDNWFIVDASALPSGKDDVTPEIWIEVS